MKEKDYFEFIMKIIIVILTLIVLYMITLKLIGRSPNLDEINFSLISIIISSLILFVYKFGKFQGKVEEVIINSKNGFIKVRGDINKLNDKLDDIKNLINKRKNG